MGKQTHDELSFHGMNLTREKKRRRRQRKAKLSRRSSEDSGLLANLGCSLATTQGWSLPVPDAHMPKGSAGCVHGGERGRRRLEVPRHLPTAAHTQGKGMKMAPSQWDPLTPHFRPNKGKKPSPERRNLARRFVLAASGDRYGGGRPLTL